MKNVHPARLAETELVSILVVLTILVEQMLSAQQITTGPTVNVHLDLLGILTANVFRVRIYWWQLRNVRHYFNKTILFIVRRGECQHDIDCPDNRACIENQCLDPCIVHSPCGKSALCDTTSHRPVCRCPSGWAGDPHTECYKCMLILGLDYEVGTPSLNCILLLDECLVDRDCPLDKACKSQECVNPCLTTQCGSRAECEVDFHTAICVCPPGLQGNPLVACVEAGCSSNNECNTNEVCDFAPGSGFARKECQALCHPGNCARGADCTAKNHKETCTCKFPLIGDGYAACLERKFL